MTTSLRTVTDLLAVCALALGATACGGGEDGPEAGDVPDDAIALVGERSVPLAEFTALMERAEQGYKAQDREFPEVGTPEYQEVKTQAVQFLVERYQYRAEAEALGIEVTDADITKRLDEVKEESFEGSDEEFAKELERLGLSEADAREVIRDQLIQQRIYDEVTGDITVTDAEITEYYEANEAEFTEPRQVRHILVEKKSVADRLASRLDDGDTFAALAREFSTDETSAKQGGKLTVTKGQTVPEFDRLAFELEGGQVSDPVKTQFGWHIIEALEPVSVTSLDEAKDTIRQQLLDQRKQEAMETWVAETRRKYSQEVVYAVGYTPAATTATGTTGTTTTEE